MSQMLELGDYFDDVLKHGDVLDSQKFLMTDRASHIRRAGQTLAFGIASIDVDYSHSLEYGITYPALGAAALVATTGINFGRRMHERRAAKNREEVQAAIRDELNEPVDIIRFRAGRRDHALTMRWYGTDRHVPGDDTFNLGTRLLKLSRVAEEHDIVTIALGADNLDNDNEAKIGLSTPYGQAAVCAYKAKHRLLFSVEPCVVTVLKTLTVAFSPEFKTWVG